MTYQEVVIWSHLPSSFHPITTPYIRDSRISVNSSPFTLQAISWNPEWSHKHFSIRKSIGPSIVLTKHRQIYHIFNDTIFRSAFLLLLSPVSILKPFSSRFSLPCSLVPNIPHDYHGSFGLRYRSLWFVYNFWRGIHLLNGCTDRIQEFMPETHLHNRCNNAYQLTDIKIHRHPVA